jgi:hypothetical protein
VKSFTPNVQRGKEMEIIENTFSKKLFMCEREKKSFKYKLIDSNKTT